MLVVPLRHHPAGRSRLAELEIGDSFMISQSVEYALRAVLIVASRGGQACPSREIAEVTRVPGPYLSKLMQSLVKSGLLTAQRGPNGGFQLSHSPEDVSLLDIVNSLEPVQRITACPLGIACDSGNLCPLHRSVDDAIAAAEKILADVRLSDLLSRTGQVTPLCDEASLVRLSPGNLESSIGRPADMASAFSETQSSPHQS
ncbi:MAG: RrF2 family transcriptional regulator [Planctomycetaceae bacterium]